MLTTKDIPDSMMANIRAGFDSDPRVLELRTHQNLLQRQGKFIEALNVGKQIDYLYSKVVQYYVDEANQEASQIHLNETGMPEEDIEQMNECVLTLFMCCDIMETAIMDANDIIHKTDTELHFEMFDEMVQLSKMVREKMRFLQENSGYSKGVIWADKCDNMYEMMRNKARSIIRKRKKDGHEQD